METFIFQKVKKSREQGYACRSVIRGKSLSLQIPSKIVKQLEMCPRWHYRIGANFDGDHPIIIISKAATAKEVEEYIWKLKDGPYHDGRPTSHRFLLPLDGVSEDLINRDCPISDLEHDSDFIRFHMTKQFKGRKKVEEPKTEVKPDELTIDLDED